MSERKDLKILLLQIRDNQNVRIEEHQSFANFSKLELHQIEFRNVIDTPSCKPKQLDNYKTM